MKLADLYARPELTLSVEFFPPKTDKGEENLFSEIEIIKRLNPAFCSVTYGAGGSTREKTVDLVDRIHRKCGLEVMCHLTVVGQSKNTIFDMDSNTINRDSSSRWLWIAAIWFGVGLFDATQTVFTMRRSLYAKR